ncbi:MAG: hypothetical protein MR345_05510 [Bacilli bacterium]|nr:hypothetical protein [Bacilli bacterium]MDD7374939.1 hypothetical protein [Bacilli bacterium]
MTDEIQLRCQLALAIVDLIWLKDKISDEERLKARLLVIEKYARFEEKELILKSIKDRFKSCHLSVFVSNLCFSHLLEKAYFLSAIFF